MPRFGTQERRVGPAPRGFIGVLLAVGIALLLAWLAFYHEPWIPHDPTVATTTPPATEQFELTEADNGRSFSYPVTSRFTVILDGRKYPQPYCAPGGIVGSISNIPAVEAPLVATRFEAVTPGSCTLTAGSWQVVVMVTD